MAVPTPDARGMSLASVDTPTNAPLELYLLRHGRTTVNSQGRLQGRTDDPLDQLGEAQAAAVGSWASAHGLQFDAVVSSPLLRARQTAALASGATLDQADAVATDELLLEMDYGPYDGFDFKHDKPDPALAAFFADFIHTPAPEGMESLDHVKERGAPFLRKCQDWYQGCSQTQSSQTQSSQTQSSQTQTATDRPLRVLVVCHAIILKGILEDLDPSLAGSWWNTYMGTCWTFRSCLLPAGAGDGVAFQPAELVFKGDEAANEAANEAAERTRGKA